MIDSQALLDWHQSPALCRTKGPVAGHNQAVQGDTIMRGQLIGGQGRAARRQILGRRANDMTDNPNLRGDHAAIGQITNPQSEINMFLQQVVQFVGKDQSNT